MGTTRMHRDPKQGVVDPDCRVHGLANLYVAGAAVFPTAGCANPTFTLVAMSLRLSDHLKVGSSLKDPFETLAEHDMIIRLFDCASSVLTTARRLASGQLERVLRLVSERAFSKLVVAVQGHPHP